jgi:hypothetical protein
MRWLSTVFDCDLSGGEVEFRLSITEEFWYSPDLEVNTLRIDVTGVLLSKLHCRISVMATLHQLPWGRSPWEWLSYFSEPLWLDLFQLKVPPRELGYKHLALES